MNSLDFLKSKGFNAVAIPLTQGKWTVIDIDDAPEILRYRWHARKRKHDSFYAARTVGDGRDARMVHLHRSILSVPENQQIDHRDCDGLNNRRCNLRPCSQAQNRSNQKGWRKSGFKGVTRDSSGWMAQITVNGKHIRLGRFKTPEAAAAAYDDAATKFFGEFARTNAKN